MKFFNKKTPQKPKHFEQPTTKKYTTGRFELRDTRVYLDGNELTVTAKAGRKMTAIR